MKIRIQLILLFSLALTLCFKAQNYINLGAGIADVRVKEWNRTIDAYNFARPWLGNKLPPISIAPLYQAGFTAILAKALFISPQLGYLSANTNSQNEGFQTQLKIHRFSGSVNFDIFFREFGLDTVSFVIRPFLRLGGGASAFLPRVRYNNELASVNDERYDPIIWTYQFHAGIGCRFSLNHWVDLMPVFQFTYYPEVNLVNFAQALHGTLSPGLVNKVSYFKPDLSLYLCFRIGHRKEK